jgi:hypothetical protein
MGRPPAALGITLRSNSAVLIAVCGPAEDARLLDRRRIELVGDELPAQAYHAAAALEPADAQVLIDRWAAAALRSARRGVDEAMAAATEYSMVGAGIVAEVRDVPPLSKVLRAHPLLHLAEGQLAREALAEAAEAADLTVHYLPPKGPHDPAHAERASSMGREAGRPWRKEHKLAAVAALTTLSQA